MLWLVPDATFYSFYYMGKSHLYTSLVSVKLSRSLAPFILGQSIVWSVLIFSVLHAPY